MNQQTSAKLKLITTMLLFGTIGIFVRNISLPSSVIAGVRGFVGAGFLLLWLKMKKTGLNKEAILHNKWKLLFSGLCIGVNWILLFEAYHYTTVATATLCYYLQPVIVMIGSHFILKETLTVRKMICVLVAVCGMIPVSGMLENGLPSPSELTGILLATGAALLYGMNIITNKTMKDMPSFDMTICCLAIASATILPYVFLTVKPEQMVWNPMTILLLATMGIVHTGVAYALYYMALKDLKAQTVAIFGYIDPIFAIILSALLLNEPLTVSIVIGAVMILGATFMSEKREA